MIITASIKCLSGYPISRSAGFPISNTVCQTHISIIPPISLIFLISPISFHTSTSPYPHTPPPPHSRFSQVFHLQAFPHYTLLDFLLTPPVIHFWKDAYSQRAKMSASSHNPPIPMPKFCHICHLDTDLPAVALAKEGPCAFTQRNRTVAPFSSVNVSPSSII